MTSANMMVSLLSAMRSAFGTNGQLTLASALIPAGIPSGNVQAFLATMPGKQLPISGAAIATDPSHDSSSSPLTEIVITGRCISPWALPNKPGITLSDIDVRVSFRLDSSGIITSTFNVLGATMTLAKTKVLLVGTAQTDGTLALQVSALSHSTSTMALADLIDVLTSNHAVNTVVQKVPLFQSIPISGVNLTFSFASGTTTKIALTTQLNDTWSVSDSDVFALAQPSITLEAAYGPPDPRGTTTNTFAAKLHATTTFGQAHFDVVLDLTGMDSLTFRATPAAGQMLAVGDLLQDLAHKLGESIPDALHQGAPDLSVVDVTASFDIASKSFTFTVDTRATGTMKLPLGLTSYELDPRVSISSAIDSTTGKRALTAHLEANLQIGKAYFALSFDLGAVKTVRGLWRTADGLAIDLRDIATAIGIGGAVPVLPHDLDLSLSSASFEYNSDTTSFTLSAESVQGGDAFFILEKDKSGKFGFVFGIDSPKSAHLSDLPVIGESFGQAAILVASGEFADFSLPPLPPLPPAPSSQAERAVAGRPIKPLVSGTTLQLKPGVSFAAELDFTSRPPSQQLANLQSIIGKSKLIVQATVNSDTKQTNIFFKLDDKVYIPARRGRLALGNPTVEIDAGGVPSTFAIELSSDLDFTVMGTPVAATARLTISETEAQVMVTVKAQQPLPSLPGIRGLRFEEFGIELGVFFEPPGVDIGLQGAVTLIGGDGTMGAKPDQYAIVLEVVEEVPNLLYLSFYIDQLDLGQVVTLFTGQPIPQALHILENFKGSDLSFHWSEAPVVLPDGTSVTPGFGFSGSIQVFKWGGHGDLDVSIDTGGISGTVEMSPINLGDVLHISGDGKGITRTFEEVNGQWTEVVNNNVLVKGTPPAPTMQKTIVAPGGPVVMINSHPSPSSPYYLLGSWQVKLLDVVDEMFSVTATNTGFLLVTKCKFGSIANANLQCQLIDKDQFCASVDGDFHVSGDIKDIKIGHVNIPKLNLDTEIAATVMISLDRTKFELKMTGDFQFNSHNLKLPPVDQVVSMNAAKDSLTNIGNLLKGLPDLALEAIRKDASEIFKDLAEELLKLGTGVEKVADNSVKSTETDIKKTDQAVQKDTKGIKRVLEGVHL